MHHLTVENLVEYILGSPVDGTSRQDPEKDARPKIEIHLSECRECSQLKGEIQNLIRDLQTDTTFEPPIHLVQWGVELFQPLLQPPTGRKLRRLIAALVFDTYEQRLQPGIRGMATTPRQLLFRAGDVNIDVKIESMEQNDRITMVGQVLSPSEKLFDGAPVKLESHGIVQYQTVTNQVGEFSFDEVPKDTYHLSVDLPEGQITLFCVHRGSC